MLGYLIYFLSGVKSPNQFYFDSIRRFYSFLMNSVEKNSVPFDNELNPIY